MFESLSIIASKCKAIFSRTSTTKEEPLPTLAPMSAPTLPEVVLADEQPAVDKPKRKRRVSAKKSNALRKADDKRCKTTPTSRNLIRARFAAGDDVKLLTEDFGLGRSTIYRIAATPMEVIEPLEAKQKHVAKPVTQPALKTVASEAVEPALQSANPAPAPELAEPVFITCSAYLGTLPRSSHRFQAKHLSREANNVCEKYGIRRRFTPYHLGTASGVYAYPVDVLEEAYLGLLAEHLLKNGVSDAEVFKTMKSALGN